MLRARINLHLMRTSRLGQLAIEVARLRNRNDAVDVAV